MVTQTISTLSQGRIRQIENSPSEFLTFQNLLDDFKFNASSTLEKVHADKSQEIRKKWQVARLPMVVAVSQFFNASAYEYHGAVDVDSQHRPNILNTISSLTSTIERVEKKKKTT